MSFINKKPVSAYQEIKWAHPVILKKVCDLYIGDLLVTGFRVQNMLLTSTGNRERFSIKMVSCRDGEEVTEEMQGDVGVWIVAEPEKYRNVAPYPDENGG